MQQLDELPGDCIYGSFPVNNASPCSEGVAERIRKYVQQTVFLEMTGDGVRYDSQHLAAGNQIDGSEDGCSFNQPQRQSRMPSQPIRAKWVIS